MKDELQNLLGYIDEIKTLNDKFYALSFERKENEEGLSDELNDMMKSALLTAYSTTHGLIERKMMISAETELYAIETKAAICVPRRRRSWRKFFRRVPNQAAKLVEEKIGSESQLYFQELLDRINVLDSAIRKALPNTAEPAAPVTDSADDSDGDDEWYIEEPKEVASRDKSDDENS